LTTIFIHRVWVVCVFIVWKDSSSLVFIDNPISSYELSHFEIMIYFSILLIFYLSISIALWHETL